MLLGREPGPLRWEASYGTAYWLLTAQHRFLSPVTSRRPIICGRRSGDREFSSSSFGFSLLIVVLLLLHTHLLSPHRVSDIPVMAARHNSLGIPWLGICPVVERRVSFSLFIGKMFIWIKIKKVKPFLCSRWVPRDTQYACVCLHQEVLIFLHVQEETSGTKIFIVCLHF
jgi:hypothetical protein